MDIPWVQLIVTVVTLVISMVVFYFKNETLLRKEILASEERMRDALKEVHDDVVEIDKRVAVMEAVAEAAQKPRPFVPSGRY